MHLIGVSKLIFNSGAWAEICLAHVFRFVAMEGAEIEGRITEEEVYQSLKTVGADKLPRIDGLPATIYDTWMKQGSIPQRFIRGIVKFPRKDKHVEDGISNFRPLAMLPIVNSPWTVLYY